MKHIKKYMMIIILILLYLIITTLYTINLDQLFYNKNIFNNKIINLSYFNSHLGDLIFTTYYFYFIKDYLEENNIIIKYYVNSIYHNQIYEFIQTPNILLYDYKPIGLNINVHVPLHLQYSQPIYKILKFNNKLLEFDIYYIDFFNHLSKILKIPILVNKFEYQNSNLLLKYNKLSEKYKNLDILIINSIPQSSQYNINTEEWNNFIIKLNNEKFKIVTTFKIPNINCTLDDNLSLFNIAAISTYSKIIIAINTGPASVLFNEYTLNYTRRIYLFDYNITYSYDKVINTNNINEININELKNLINSK